MSHCAVEPGIVQVIYETAEDMAPSQQGPLLELLKAEAGKGPVAIVFLVRKIARVDPSVPRFWLDATKDLNPALLAMAIASSSMAVRVAAKAFGAACSMRGLSVAVAAFSDEAEALVWARKSLPLRAAVPSGPGA